MADPQLPDKQEALKELARRELARRQSTVQDPTAGLDPYAAAQATTEQQISQRPSMIQNMAQQVQNPMQFAQQHPIQTALTPMRAAGALMEGAESIPANLALATQRGDLPMTIPQSIMDLFSRQRTPQDMMGGLQRTGQDLLQGVTGQRPAQMGDPFRASGIPGFKEVAPLAGMALTSGVGATKAFQPVNKFANTMQKVNLGLPMQVGKTLTDEVIRKPLGRVVDPILEFPYRKSLEVKQGLVRFFTDINKDYGQKLDKLFDGINGEVNTVDLAGALRRRLQEAELLDFNGNPIPEMIATAGKQVQPLLDTYLDLATNPNPTVPFKVVNNTLRQWRGSISQAAKSGNRSITPQERVVTGVLHDVAKMIEHNDTSLADINAAYAQERQLFEAGNQIFKVFRGKFDTRQGENAIKNFYAQPQGVQKLFEALEPKIKVKLLQGVRAYSAYNQVTKNPVLQSTLGTVMGAGRLAANGLPIAIQAIADKAAPLTQGRGSTLILRELQKVIEKELR